MLYTPIDTERWTSADHQRAHAAATTRAAWQGGPWSGDILVHPDGARSRLWITGYSGQPYAIGDDPAFGFILAPGGDIDYTGTATLLSNAPIALGDLTGGTTTAPADFWLDRLDEELPGDVLTFTIDVRVWHTPESVPDPYTALAQRIYTDESSEPELTELEARIIAGGWAGEYYCPHLAAWVDCSGEVDPAVLVAEARQLRDDLGMHVEDWPHAGEAHPSIAAVAALIAYLQGL